MTTRKIGKCLFSCLAICLLLVLGMPWSSAATLQTGGIKNSSSRQYGSTWVETLSAGFSHTCRVNSDGTINCWGLNDSGQSAPPDETFTQVSSGYVHTCGLKNDGTVACWGLNGDGQSTPPGGTFTQVSAGEFCNCGVKSDGTLACWGQNYYGQSTPPAGTFIQISVGARHTCGVRNDGSVACWGWNNYGQSTPPLGTFTQVSAGAFHNCGVKSDGTLVCWGNDNYGQSTPPDGVFTQISAGFFHTCGMKNDGSVACWGDNQYSQAIPPGGTFTQVSSGEFYTCGAKSDGSIICWGDNTEGQSSPYMMPYTIYGNAGMWRATLSYDDGSLKTVTSDRDGGYSISVPYNWSGTVTPSRADYTFAPPNRDYANLNADEVNQDYSAYRTFVDVPYYYSSTLGGVTYYLHGNIEALYGAGYTAGCLTDPLRYCPDNPMTRAESAVFMLRGEVDSGYAPPVAPWGSNRPRRNPTGWLSRVQAAVFGLRMLHGMSYVPPDATGALFADMTDTSYWGTKWAEQAYIDGLVLECGTSGGNPMFCPNDPLTRAWGAYLIVRAKNLPLIP